MKRIRILPYQRKKKTYYRKRLKLLESNKPRLVVRKSLNNIFLQLVEYQPKGDKVLVTVNSVVLKKIGWTFHKGNLPAAYLTGLLLGVKAKEKNINEAILDIGLQTSTKGSRIYAALKGAIDAGLKIPHSKNNLPSEDRIKGAHIQKYTQKNITEKFEEVKNKILKK